MAKVLQKARFRDDTLHRIGVGTKFRFNNEFMIVGTTGGSIQMLDSKGYIVPDTNTQVTDPTWLTRSEFEQLTRKFHYTHSDWEFIK